MPVIRETVTARCPFTAVLPYIEQFFEQHPKLRLRAPGAMQADVAPAFAVVNDELDLVRSHDALQVSWTPYAHLPLPAFSGTVTVRPAPKGATVRIEGTYDPPLGKAGEVFDAVAGKTIARATIRELLDEIAVFIHTAWEKDRLQYPTIEELNARK